MENKTTTELLNLLQKLDTEKDFSVDGKYQQIMNVLKEREPFCNIFNEDYENSLEWLGSQIEELKSEIKKLKRHKHDEKTNDVLIRI